MPGSLDTRSKITFTKRSVNQSSFNIISGRSNGVTPTLRPQRKIIPQSKSNVFHSSAAKVASPRNTQRGQNLKSDIFHLESRPTTPSVSTRSSPSLKSDIFHKGPDSTPVSPQRSGRGAQKSDIFNRKPIKGQTVRQKNYHTSAGLSTGERSARGRKKTQGPTIVKTAKTNGIRIYKEHNIHTDSQSIPRGGKLLTSQGGTQQNNSSIPDHKYMPARKPQRRMKQKSTLVIKQEPSRRSPRKSNPGKSSVNFSILNPPTTAPQERTKSMPRQQLMSTEESTPRSITRLSRQDSDIFNTTEEACPAPSPRRQGKNAAMQSSNIFFDPQKERGPQKNSKQRKSSTPRKTSTPRQRWQ